MIARFCPSEAWGQVDAPPSKTLAHRELIAASLSDTPAVVHGVLTEENGLSDDIEATLDCIRSLGARVTVMGTDVEIRPKAGKPSDLFPCRESGSTLRFFLPLALLSDSECRFTGSERLFSRPLGVYEELCREQGLVYEPNPGGLRVKGPLSPGTFRIRGDVSSQFVTGLLFALPFLPDSSTLELIPPVVSLPYLLLTVRILREAGITIQPLPGENPDVPAGFFIPGRQRASVGEAFVEGDYSGAVFLDAFRLMGGDVRVGNLKPDSLQGDRAYLAEFPKFPVSRPIIDVENTPDLAPAYMALGALFHGVTLNGTARLRFKESDRGAAMAEELLKFGVRCCLGEDTLTVRPAPKPLAPPSSPINSHNDHRIAMAMSLLLSKTGGELHEAEAVRKSFPGFFPALRKLHIEVTEYDDSER